MSFAATTKHARVSHLICRYVSTGGKSKPISHRTLPSVKMRALISLYHQADTFITPENLSQRIDQAFLPDNAHIDVHVAATVKDLRNALNDQRAAPKLSQWDHERVVNSGYGGLDDFGWSARRSVREQKVIEALYGVDMTRLRGVLPGLEVLEESAESIERSLDEDLEAAEREGRTYEESSRVP